MMQTLADRTMEQRWEVRKLWDRAHSPESPGGIAVIDCESAAIYERMYSADGYDANVGRTCSMVEYARQLLNGTRGMESRNFLRGITAFVRGHQIDDSE